MQPQTRIAVSEQSGNLTADQNPAMVTITVIAIVITHAFLMFGRHHGMYFRRHTGFIFIHST